MFHRILVPLNGARHAELAIPAAARLARVSKGTIVLAHIITSPAIIHSSHGPIEQTTQAQKTKADEYLHTVMQNYASDLQDIAVETDREEVGSLSAGILSAARLEHVDLIVTCFQGETFFNHWLFKHMPRNAIRHTTVPVLALNEHGKLLPDSHTDHPFHVLIPLDGSAIAEAVLEPTAQLLAALTQAEQKIVVQLLNIIDTSHTRVHGQGEQESYQRARDEAATYLRTIAGRIESHWPHKPTVISSILDNPKVSETILHQAERVVDYHTPDGCDLIAMATHGRGGVQRMLHGSVTEQVLVSSHFPLLIVTPPQF